MGTQLIHSIRMDTRTCVGCGEALDWITSHNGKSVIHECTFGPTDPVTNGRTCTACGRYTTWVGLTFEGSMNN